MIHEINYEPEFMVVCKKCLSAGCEITLIVDDDGWQLTIECKECSKKRKYE